MRRLAGLAVVLLGLSPILSPAKAEMNFVVDASVPVMLINGVPDIYADGEIDAQAPSRLVQLISTGSFAGATVYFNSPGGLLNAGLELGRLIRRYKLSTGLGVWQPDRFEATSRREPATCLSACAYAFLGGVFRHHSTGSDTLGYHQFTFIGRENASNTESAQVQSAAIVEYLRDMGIDPLIFSMASAARPEQVLVFSPSEALKFGLVNNGRLPLHVDYRLRQGHPYLRLSQETSRGETKLLFACLGGSIVIQGLMIVGQDRAHEIISTALNSYLTIDDQPMLKIERDGVGPHKVATVINESILIVRSMAFSEVPRLTSARYIGCWMDHQNGWMRWGFAMDMELAREKLVEYAINCVSKK